MDFTVRLDLSRKGLNNLRVVCTTFLTTFSICDYTPIPIVLYDVEKIVIFKSVRVEYRKRNFDTDRVGGKKKIVCFTTLRRTTANKK